MVKRFDVNPQFMRLEVVEDTVNVYNQKEYPTPVVEQIESGKALVMELLKIMVWLHPPEAINATKTKTQMHISSKTNGSIQSIAKHGTYADNYIEKEVLDTAVTDATFDIGYVDSYRVFDLTDGNGNGVLFGKKSMFIAVKGSSNVAVKSALAMVIYRLKKVSAVELIGLIHQD